MPSGVYIRTEKHKPNLGKHCSQETKDKLSNALKGRVSPMKGRKHSDDSKSRISKSLIGRTSPKKGIKTGISYTIGKEMPLGCKEKHRLAMINRYSNKEERKRQSDAQINRYLSVEERKKTSKSTKIALNKPDVRKRHIEALAETKWLGKSVDRGQIDLLNKWNRMGFKFEPNYQIHTNDFLAYLDGYDKDKNVVIEYDSKYHNRPNRQRADLLRQEKIIDILKPKVFWRYNAVSKECKAVYRSDHNLINN
jgi:hypothetical protein